MSTFTQIYYHLVFSTKHRVPCLHKESRNQLYNYIWGYIRNKKSHLYRIGGVEDHVYIFTSLHPTIDLSAFVRDMKTSSTGWIKENDLFPFFQCWQIGYGAFTKSHADKDRMIEYIINQEEHHRHVSFEEELRELLREAGMPFDERYLD